MDKYKINEYLHQLNVNDYRKAIKILPKALGVSVNTFHNYRRIQKGDIQDIPHEKFAILERLLDRKNQLENFSVNVKPLKELMKDLS